ncbi:AIR synthase-related protein, partial [Salinarimonas sp.]|uniref:AIR synthase-related protein n=1 Tax=Salinarimonas sp. TaxID=2766526 RepID=UPI003919F751
VAPAGGGGRAPPPAAMDVSDGLAGDLAKMCRESGTSAEVDLALLPLSAAARAAIARDPDLLDRCITGGDDYEILCAVPDESVASFLDSCAQARVPAAVIGRMVEGDALPVFRDAGVEKRYASGSYRHF